jgi:hypothetical protein
MKELKSEVASHLPATRSGTQEESKEARIRNKKTRKGNRENTSNEEDRVIKQ